MALSACGELHNNRKPVREAWLLPYWVQLSRLDWATCGAASYMNTATTNGEAALLITPSGQYLITNNIEATRLEQEEKLAAQGWEFRVVLWHEAQDTVSELARGLRLGADRP